MLAIILTAVYAAYTSNLDAIQAARVSGQSLQTARMVFDRMSKDLQSALIGLNVPDKKVRPGLIGENREIDGRPADRLDFTTLAHLFLTEGSPNTDLCEVGYFLEEDEEDGGFILYRRDHGIVDEGITKGGQAFELARMVTGMDILFQDINGEEVDEWNTMEGPHKDRLPALIRITLTLMNERGDEQTFITSVHPELAGAGK